MSTGSFENWAGNIAEIGAIYPFEGSETLLLIIGVAFWLWWHIKQARDEEKHLAEQEKELQQDPEYLRNLLEKSTKQ